MSEVISEVKSAQITYAVRETVVDDKPISPGDILGILENKIKNVDSSIDAFFIVAFPKKGAYIYLAGHEIVYIPVPARFQETAPPSPAFPASAE